MAASSNFLERNRFLLKIFTLTVLVSTLVWFTNAKDADLIEKPKFTYVEGNLVKISFINGVNQFLYLCCNASNLIRQLPTDLAKIMKKSFCGHMSQCPDFKTWPSCTILGQEVCCQVQHVLEKIRFESYVARFEQNEKVSSSDVATFVTKKSEMIPRAVTGLNVTSNSKRGLNIRWNRLSKRHYIISQSTHYTQKVDCHPLENYMAKAVSIGVDITESQITINEKNISGSSKYRCCVRVVKGLSSRESEPLCANVTTSEQAPSSPPVIICGNVTACPYVVEGTKRNITIKFLPPSPESWNGKIMRHELYYKNATAANTTKLTIVNGSSTEAVIPGAETAVSYHVFMTSCNKVDCSPISNTVLIPAVSYHKKIARPIVKIVAGSVAAVCLLVLLAIILARHQRQQNPLPELGPPPNPLYEYPDKDVQDNNYHELVKPSDNPADYKIEFLGSTVIVNPTAQAAVKA